MFNFQITSNMAVDDGLQYNIGSYVFIVMKVPNTYRSSNMYDTNVCASQKNVNVTMSRVDYFYFPLPIV